MDYKGRYALITGASRGIGLAAARLMAQRNANLILVDVNEEGLMRAAEAVRAEGAQVLTYVCDVQDEHRVNEVVSDALQKVGRIDILVNNAGIYRENRSHFVDSNSDIWSRYININILGAMYFTHALLGSMLENHYGRIVNIASVAGVYGIANMVPYSMTKGAIISFTVALAKEVTEHGVLVNAVSPGNIQPPEDGLNLPALSFANRSGTPEECAEVICFLASDEASYVSGQNYLVDGCRKQM